MSSNLSNEIAIVENKIQTQYQNLSNLDSLCSFIPKSKLEDSERTWMRNVLKIQKLNFIETDFNTADFVQDILKDEMDYFFNNVRQNAKIVDLDNDELDSITSNISSYFKEITPDTLVIPYDLSSEIPKWNKQLHPHLSVFPNDKLILGSSVSLDVVVLPKFIDFNDILITHSPGNILNFISQKSSNPRIWVGHESHNDIISIFCQSWYFYETKNPEHNLIIDRSV